MKIYKELYFKGNEEQLLDFANEIKAYQTSEWRYKRQVLSSVEYIDFSYTGNKVDKATVSICLYSIKNKQIRVGNIIPEEKDNLTIDEYNAVLDEFYKEVISPYEEHGAKIEISPYEEHDAKIEISITDDVFDPLSIISQKALTKLKSFCDLANKTTGSQYPSDKKRWLDFICQTVSDKRVFDINTLEKFLIDESYWGKKQAGFNGVIGKFAWDERNAYELATEYDVAVDAINYYLKNFEVKQ